MAARKKAAKPGKTAEPKPVKVSDNAVVRRNEELNQITVGLIKSTAKGVHEEILGHRKPDLAFPVRSLGNVKYTKDRGYFEIGRQKKLRTLTVNTVKSFAQTLRMMGLSKELVENNDFATKRDAYYQSKNWEEARFDEQPESDAVMDDIEALFSVRGVNREQLRFIPDEHGGAVAGRLVVLDPDRETGVVERIDCTRFGSGAYSIPSSVEHLSFETDAKFILAIETGGVFQRLQSHKFWQTANCILVVHGGRADPRDAPVHPEALRRVQAPGLRLRRLRPLRDLEHLPDAQGRLGERRAPEPVLLRAARALPRRDAGRHPRVPAADPPAPRRRRQARAATR